MKALILAAGFGSRLVPITNYKPKSLVKVNGTPIIFKQIENLEENGIHDITIITGYLSSVINEVLRKNYPEVRIITNKDYAKTNNMYSAYLAGEIFKSDLLMMNADVFFDSCIISSLLNCSFPNAIAVDKARYLKESMKISFDGIRIKKISKEISPVEAYGTSIDVYKFSRESAIKFFEKCRYYIEEKNELNLWSEVALDSILSKEVFLPCDITGRWVEIDNHEDLKIAQRLFA